MEAKKFNTLKVEDFFWHAVWFGFCSKLVVLAYFCFRNARINLRSQDFF